MSSKKASRRLNRLNRHRTLIASSILASDFTELGKEVERATECGTDVIHVDIMDGHFVPNLSVGPPVVKAIREQSELPFDVHLMVDNPENFIVPFAEAGADNISIHIELSDNPEILLDRIHSLDCSAGLVLKPATPAATLSPWLKYIDLILVMSVEPGFGGQEFMPSSLEKISQLHNMIEESGRNIHLEVDGGINEKTASQAVAAGANLLVAGTSIFRDPEGVCSAIRRLRGG